MRQDEDSADLVESILRGTAQALQGDYVGGLDRLAKYVKRTRTRQQLQQPVDIPTINPNDPSDPFFGDFTDEINTGARGQAPAGCTCVRCEAQLPKGTKVCPQCGGRSFLEPVQ